MTEKANGSSCVENIGPRERGRRFAGGAVALALGLGLAAQTVGGGFWWRPLPLFLLFWAGALGIFQALDRT